MSRPRDAPWTAFRRFAATSSRDATTSCRIPLVVTRGCPQHCDFCYKDAFFAGGRSFYTQRVDDALAEIARLPGRHLYFLDDHLLGDRRFGRALFEGMKGMNRLFQGAATVDSILRDDLVERAADAGLRSLFVGFETLTPANLATSNKRQNLGRDYRAVTTRLHDLGIMINGSFVFGMDEDDADVFERTVEWAIEAGITTATFHIQTPYPGTRLLRRDGAPGPPHHAQLGPLRHATCRLSTSAADPACPRSGYAWAYRAFYRWSAIARAAATHRSLKHQVKHFAYAVGLEEIRGGVESGDQGAPASLHDAAAGGSARGGHAHVSRGCQSNAAPGRRRRPWVRSPARAVTGCPPRRHASLLPLRQRRATVLRRAARRRCRRASVPLAPRTGVVWR